MNPTYIQETQLDPSVCDSIFGWFFSGPELSPGHTNIDNELKIVESVKDSIDCSYYKDEFEELDDCFKLYFNHLSDSIDQYRETYPEIDHMPPWGMVEPVNIQYYNPSAGYHEWHCENTFVGTSSKRVLVFMTYLNDVPDGGTEFKYYPTSEAKKGKTLIWPTGWTHTHRSQVCHTSHKMIITGWLGVV